MGKAKICIAVMWNDIPMKLNAKAPLQRSIQSAVDGRNSKYEIGLYFENEGCSLVSAGRWESAKKFLASDCTHLLFVDSDSCVIRNDSIERLLSHNKGIVSGLFTNAKIAQEIKPTYKPFDEEELYRRFNSVRDDDKLLKVETTGFHFTLISRKCVEDVFKFSDSKSVMPFQPMLHNGEYEGEDGAFCRRALSCGHGTYVDLDVPVGHWGDYCFTVYHWLEFYKRGHNVK